jgi:3-hydroxybutyryl-CoA dehydrogenase
MLYDVAEDGLEKALGRIDESLALLVRKGLTSEDARGSSLGRISTTTDLAEAVESAGFVIEAAPEDLALKQGLFAELERLAPTDAILATNSSSLPLGKITSGVKGGERVVGSHFFMPAQLIPLVEVSRGESTTDETVERTVRMWESCGKSPIRVNRDIPGYVANRLQAALVREAVALWSGGVASAGDIDTAVRMGFGLRAMVTGPMRQRDLAGIDLHLAIQRELWPEIDGSVEPNPEVVSMVERGQLGLKTGRGYFDWSGQDPEQVLRAQNEALVDMMAATGLWPSVPDDTKEERCRG